MAFKIFFSKSIAHHSLLTFSAAKVLKFFGNQTCRKAKSVKTIQKRLIRV
jgi:hypothetical protein